MRLCLSVRRGSSWLPSFRDAFTFVVQEAVSILAAFEVNVTGYLDDKKKRVVLEAPVIDPPVAMLVSGGSGLRVVRAIQTKRQFRSGWTTPLTDR